MPSTYITNPISGKQSRKRLWSVEGKETGGRPKTQNSNADYNGEILGDFVDRVLEKGRREEV
ncbi:hypothetical protein B0A48_03773 [Cryoendolithus antarcticus]|uniref:Uncharacterized protein n=1 Tax=Cryoendolithus antarcticus TaxID=1507870 RepID=A0A1V8TGG7_9PEZI|nr:hypothetical protein B0A48_03773 [Cryoendolithus antarcticus]